MTALLGALSVFLSGLISGSGAWPIKAMRCYRFEHWWFVGMLSGYIVFPWAITFLVCPNAVGALRSVPTEVVVKANLWSTSWGVASILCGLCYVRIGLALTTCILGGLGICLGVTVPLLFKGSGIFQNAPPVTSTPGLTVLAGAAVALAAVMLAGKAGYDRELALGGSAGTASLLGSLAMTVVAGLLSCGCAFSFVYGQAPIVAALKANGSGDIAAACGVWGVALAGGAFLSVGYAAFLLTKRKTWHLLFQSWREFSLALVIGVNIAVSIVFLGSGMLLMGALGGAVGAGLQQISWIFGGQGAGFLSGEWRGVKRRPRVQMWFAMALLFLAAIIIACGSRLNHPR